MKKSDFPDYITIKYYYSNKKTSNRFLFGESGNKLGVSKLIAEMILTSDNCIYFSLKSGNIIIPDDLSINDRIVPDNWISNDGIKYAIKNQLANTHRDYWAAGYSFYSKDFWHYIYNDFLDFRLRIALGEVSFDSLSKHSQIIKY